MIKEEEQLCGQIFHPPGVVHVAVLLVSLLDVEGCLRYSQVECIFIKFERVDLCAAFKLLLLVFLGGDRVRNLLRDTLLPVLVLTIHYRARRPIGFLKVKKVVKSRHFFLIEKNPPINKFFIFGDDCDPNFAP